MVVVQRAALENVNEHYAKGHPGHGWSRVCSSDAHLVDVVLWLARTVVVNSSRP